MASFSSGGSNKAPSQPTIIYTPPPVQTPLPDTTPIPDVDDNIAPSPEVVHKEREQNLLRRARSGISTVLNGFRGILAPLNPSAQRKSLLGE